MLRFVLELYFKTSVMIVGLIDQDLGLFRRLFTHYPLLQVMSVIWRATRLAPGLGFEPRIPPPKGDVLPLHHPGMVRLASLAHHRTAQDRWVISKTNHFRIKHVSITLDRRSPMRASYVWSNALVGLRAFPQKTLCGGFLSTTI